MFGQAPIVDFEADPVVCLGSEIQFSDLSTIVDENEIIQWSWDFGDGNTSLEQSPIHTFSQTGSYIVTLTATTSIGCSKSFSKTIEVLPNPVAFFEARLGCKNTPHQFIDLSETPEGEEIASWFWDFGNGQTSIQSNPAIIFENPGEIYVSVLVTSSNGCTSFFEDSVSIVTNFPYPEQFSIILPKPNNFYNPGLINF